MRCSDLYDNFERLSPGGVSKDLIDVENPVELEAVRDQFVWVKLMRCDCLDQHRYGDGVD